jgi:hypothetical protein
MKPIPNRLPQPAKARLPMIFCSHQHTINNTTPLSTTKTSPPLRLPTHIIISTNSAIITILRTRSSINRSSRTLRLGFPTTATTSPSKTTTSTATLNTPTPRSLLRQSRTPTATRGSRTTGAVAETAASAALAGSAGVETGVVGRGRRRGLVDARRRR